MFTFGGRHKRKAQEKQLCQHFAIWKYKSTDLKEPNLIDGQNYTANDSVLFFLVITSVDLEVIS